MVMGKHSNIIAQHFDTWHGSAPASNYCARCNAQFEPGAEFLIGKTISVADVQICSESCAVAELVIAGIIKPRSRTETVPVPFLQAPGASRVWAAERMAALARGGK